MINSTKFSYLQYIWFILLSIDCHVLFIYLYRGSYMSAHVLLNLLNELGKEIKCEACRAFYLFFATSLIN